MAMEIAHLSSVVGRIFLGGLFLLAGLRHLFIMPLLVKRLALRGVPVAGGVPRVGTAFQIVAGTMLMLGHFVVPAALGLILFTIIASIVMLDFWNMDGLPRETAKNAWLTNVGVIGGLLLAAAGAIN